MSISESISSLRIESGMTQQTLADLLHVSRDLVSKWERGSRRPDYQTLEKIAEIFSVPIESIVDKNTLFLSELSECFQDSMNVSEEKLIALLNAFLHKQTARNAGVFLKRYYFQKSITEISAEYGIRENHVRSILSKIRRKLKKYVEENNHE